MSNYLKSFIIGSSLAVVLPFYLKVATIQEKSYTYEFYSIIAPLYFGIMNMFSLYLAQRYHLSLRMRYIIIGLLSPLIVFSVAFTTRAYPFNSREWVMYAIRLTIKHFLVYNVIIYYLEKNISIQTELLKVTENEQAELQKMMDLIVKRGLLAPDCKWWEVSSLTLQDASGVEFYYKLKEKYHMSVIPVKMVNETINVVTDINYIRTILDNSPFIFGVGKLKRRMFNTFMAKNVGISHGCEWIERRTINVKVLFTDRLHEYAEYYYEKIKEILYRDGLPTNFDQWLLLSRKITGIIVFGIENVPEQVFQVFSQANSTDALTDPNFQIPTETMQAYTKYLYNHLLHPLPNSLILLATQASTDYDELMHQIPHWIFPIIGQIHTTIPRVLLVLSFHQNVQQRLYNVTSNLQTAHEINNCYFLRSCVLETLRLNNPVVTTFRTLLTDFTFSGDTTNYPKGTQFLILNNPILRDPEFFKEPNQYIPQRWSSDLETSYHSIMFNQGPQRCPGKDLALFVISTITVEYLKMTGGRYKVEPKIDTDYIPQMINPCRLRFTL